MSSTPVGSSDQPSLKYSLDWLVFQFEGSSLLVGSVQDCYSVNLLKMYSTPSPSVPFSPHLDHNAT
jgi:hypothetical protein